MTALGTGNPYVRKSQASAAWLVEVPAASQEEPIRFLFDLGTGSMANFAVLQIPFEDAHHAFLSHLHSDHWGDGAHDRAQCGLPPRWLDPWNLRADPLRL
ncbi:MAG: hypothetical protein MI919_41540 [Holophagales bacterium]|nr:hypothetical protein [Holophagales bacterium]